MTKDPLALVKEAIEKKIPEAGNIFTLRY